MLFDAGANATEHKFHQLTHHMNNYQQQLKCKYRSLKLTLHDEILDCYSAKYIDLMLLKGAHKQQNRILKEPHNSITLHQALNIEKEEKKVVLIEGGPGMGKSTLTINICKCWAEGSILQNYDAVILLPLREKRIQKVRVIGDLLQIVDDEMRDGVLREVMESKGERICFIFEGYDELSHLLHKSPIFTKLMEELPKCMVIYTSRPEACAHLRGVASLIITIDGFKEESVDEYISATYKNLKNGEKMASKLQSQVHNNSVIRNTLQTPINVAIVCLIFFHFSTLPETLTELYTLLCLRLILRHITTRTPNEEQVENLKSLNDLPLGISEQFSQLCYIAYRGIKIGKVEMSSQDLNSFGVIEDRVRDLGLLLITPSISVYGREKSYNFLHLTLQEFCAAWYISKLSIEEQMQLIKTYCFGNYIYFDDNNNDKDDEIDDYDHFKMVWRFYSGITGLNNKEVLNCMLPYVKLEATYNYWGKFYELVHFVYEAHNSEACQAFVDHFGAEFHLHLWPSQFELNYILIQYKGKLHLKLDLVEEILLQILLEILEKRLSLHNDARCSLTFSDIMEYDDGSMISFVDDMMIYHIDHEALYSSLKELLTLQYPIIELNMHSHVFDRSKTLSIPAIRSLSNMLSISSTLSVLDISQTNIGPEGAAYLADNKLAYDVINDLRMSGCGLGPVGADEIGKILSYNCITSIDLSENDITDSGVENLVHHLKDRCTLQHLDLSSNKITAVGADYLRILLAADSPTLTSIGLSHNPLKDEGTMLVLQSLPMEMKYIGLRKVDITSSSSHCVATVLTKVKSLRISEFDDCKVISDSLSATTTLEQLQFYANGPESIKVIKAVGKNGNIKSLELEYSHGNVLCHHIAGLEYSILHTKSLTKLMISCLFAKDENIPLKLARSLAMNTSIITAIFKIFFYISYGPDNFYCDAMDQEMTLQFLKQLKQNFTLEDLTLEVSSNVSCDCLFVQKVENLVQNLNSIRKSKGVSRLITVHLIT